MSEELSKQKKEFKQKQNELHLKELEYNVIDNLQMKEINEMLLSQNGFVYETIKQFYDDGRIPDKDIKIDPKSLPKRLPRADRYSELYLNCKRNIYMNIPQQELKELVEQCSQNKRLMASKQVQDRNQLWQQYSIEYQQFLQRQPEVEYNRRQMMQELAEVQELMSVLNNLPTFEKVALWNQETLGEQDQSAVRKQVEEKINTVQKRFQFANYQTENEQDDILKEVQEYLKATYFNQ